MNPINTLIKLDLSPIKKDTITKNIIVNKKIFFVLINL